MTSARPAPTGLTSGARRVLQENWTGSCTVPSPGLYPHQWSWDSAFIAIGSRHISPRRAQRELETLLAAQWGDGRIPHIVFNPAVPPAAYFPGPDFWRSATAGAAAGAPRHTETSGIVQPPVHALACLLVHRADPRSSARHGFLARAYPRLAAWHRYLGRARDLGGGGLVSVVHPWEPGMDNSPCWDAPLARVAPAPPGTFRRADLDHGAASDRPTDLDYGRYVRLAADYRDGGYADHTAGSAFLVEDPGVNALLIASEHALAEIAALLGADAAPHRTRAADLTAALVDRLWDPAAGLFLCRDLHGGGPVRDLRSGGPVRDLHGGGSVRELHGGGPVRDLRGGGLVREFGAAGLLPLLVPGLPGDIAAALVRTACGDHFGLGRTARLVPSYDLLGPAFDLARYWRGPAWFNVNWLLERGLRLHGEPELADALRTAVLETAVTSGFAEYVDPYTGEARGTRDFSWTAALALDLAVAAGQEP
ncbi:MGH1-like glycoside hydrolase domain-containing protein [Streptomyces hygroscopicus]|uniref:MGH1-like glycoside hydrolase domain-containing protein n=1 Tax=Streptomyces hygroscopicus TaxID=1912 RepID=UPI0037A96A08